MKALRKYLLAALALCAGAGIVLFPGELSEAVRGSVGGCLEVVIPALFAFTVLAVYLQRSGLYRVVLKPLTVPLSKLLRLPEELCAVFLLSNIGGYPVGAKLLTGLVRSGRLRRGDASRLLCCCYGSGPSFVIGTAGMQVFGSAAAGGMIFGACILSSLAEAAVVCRFGKPILLDESSSAQDLSAECFISSVDAGARVMYTVCVMSVAFAAVTALLDSAGITELAAWALGKLGLGGNSDRLLPARAGSGRRGGFAVRGGSLVRGSLRSYAGRGSHGRGDINEAAADIAASGGTAQRFAGGSGGEAHRCCGGVFS